MASESDFPYSFFKQTPPSGSREEQLLEEYAAKNEAIPSFVWIFLSNKINKLKIIKPQ